MLPKNSISSTNQPDTRFNARRPLEMWSMVTLCLAATIGCSAGTCAVATIIE
ncbi:hypothetical protein D3C83_311070 [compost metagenome]